MLSMLPLGVVLLAVVVSFLVYTRRRTSALPYPPGPKGYPLIGNAFDIPRDVSLWKAAVSMGERHDSDVLYLNVFGADQIILNSNEAISDLLDKRSAIYSDRPRFPMIELMDGYSWALPLLRYGDRWKASRRLLHQFLNTRATNTYDDQQHHYSHDFLLRLTESPQDLWDHIKFTTGALIMYLTYGFDIKSHEDPFLSAAERALAIMEEVTVPGAFLVDKFPILKRLPSWFPGTKFKQIARTARKDIAIAVDGPLESVKSGLKSGSARNASIASTCLDRINDLGGRGFTEEHIRMITASMYIGKGLGFLMENNYNIGNTVTAAVDTTLAISQVFFLLMAIHPNIQQKAQKEINQLLGGERLPTLADKINLPYTSAVIKEIYRWHAPLPISIPKALTEDDVYKGYYMPKGATVMENVWAVFNDPSEYPEPQIFNPERFLKDGKLDHSVRDPEDRVFGSSRRVCPGKHFANRAVFLRVATVLATFNIEPGVNDNGEVASEAKIHDGIVRHPALFKCLVKPRSDAALKLVRDAHTVESH